MLFTYFLSFPDGLNEVIFPIVDTDLLFDDKGLSSAKSELDPFPILRYSLC